MRTALNSQSRVFLIDGRAWAGNKPEFQGCLKAGGIDQSFGDVETIECPDPFQFGKFHEIGKIRGAVERASVSLTGRYALDVQSELLRLARKGCTVDVQLHFGTCTDPRDFDSYAKAVILEDSILTDYSTEDLGSLSSDEQGKIDESATLSARSVYEIVPLGFAERAQDEDIRQLRAITIADIPSCGDCENPSDGCNAIFATGLFDEVTPGETDPAIVYSLDGGATWSFIITSETNLQEPQGIAQVGKYIVMISGERDGLFSNTGRINYVLKSDFVNGSPTITVSNQGFPIDVNTPMAIASVGSRGFIAGLNGYIYLIDSVESGVEVVDARIVHTSNYYAVHALSREFAVVVGAAGAIAVTDRSDGRVWTDVMPHPDMAGLDLYSVWLKSKREWLVGSNENRLWYTSDGGLTWTEKKFPGSNKTGLDRLNSISFSTDSVGYMAGAQGNILRTINGGYSWNVMPDGVGQLPEVTIFTEVATCVDPNFVAASGSLFTQGTIVLGTG